MTSKHKNPAYKKRVAIAPYNFVPLPEAILTTSDLPDHDRYDPDLLTGKLTCTLTTASPLYVRAARTWQEYTHKNEKGEPDPKTPPDPYYGETKDTLLIPGSSLRGMLRNLVEVVSYSRISGVTNKPPFFRTVDVSSIGKAYGKRMSGGDAGEKGWFTLSHAGYMERKNGDFFIRPAQEIFGTQHYRVHEDIALEAGIPNLAHMTLHEGERWKQNKEAYKWIRPRVWFIPVPPTSHLPESPTYYADVQEISVERPEGPEWQEGCLIASGWVPSKGRGKRRHWIVGPPAQGDNLIEINDEDIELYKARGVTQEITRQGNFSVLPEKDDQRIPCFYTFWKDKQGKDHVAFGHTGMFRLPYQKSPADMLPASLTQETGYDLTEAMFGFVDQARGSREAVAGRVFVTDAKLVGDPKQALLSKPITLSDQALSSPKPTTVQHYLEQSDPDHPENLKHYDNDPNTETQLRGHKFYWHVGADQDHEQRLARAPKYDPDARQNDRANQFRPVKAGQSFTFDIHFENLHPQELGALLWVLDKAGDSKYRLKLGMGKPYGLGSVAIKYMPLLTDRRLRYKKIFDDDGWNEGCLPEEQTEERVQDAKQRFHRYILDDPRLKFEKLESIDGLPRIQELLALMTWEGRPGEEKTRYMELEEFTGRKSIFSELTGRASKRPVLPTPTKVLDNQWFKGLPAEEPSSRSRSSFTSEPQRPPARSNFIAPKRVAVPPPVKRERPPEKEIPAPVDKRPGQLSPGDIIRGVVDEYTPPHKMVTLALSNAGEFDYAVIPEDKSGISPYKKAQTVLLRVIEVSGSETAGYEVICEPA